MGGLAWGHSPGCLFQSVLGGHEESLKFLGLNCIPSLLQTGVTSHLVLQERELGVMLRCSPYVARINSSRCEHPQAPSLNVV